MNDWTSKKFKDFITLQRGFDLPANNRIEGEYPIMSATSISGTHNEYKVEPPVITTGRSGSLGDVVWSDKKSWPLNTTLWVKDFKSNDPKFIYYYLKTLKLEQYNSGGAVPTLNRNHLDNLDVVVPLEKVQKSISGFLNKYDSLITINQKRIKILEEMAQAIYTEWFVNFRFPGHEKVRLVDSNTDFSEIPEGWRIEKLKGVGKIITGKTPSKSDDTNFGDDVPFIKTPDLHGQMFCIETKEKLSVRGADSQKNKDLPKNTLVVSCIGTVGVVSVTTQKSQTNQQINALILNDASFLEYGYYVLKRLKKHLQNLGANGATMGNVNKGKFENIEITIPPQVILEEFHLTTSWMFQLIENLQRQNIHLAQIRDLLIPKLVTGEVEIKG